MLSFRPDPPLPTRPDSDPPSPDFAADAPPTAVDGSPSDPGSVTVTGTFPAGRMVGRYRVSRRLGSGGFARVYSALDPDLELDVALKILRPELAADPDTVERFRREATTAAKLRHPNVITVLTVGRLEEPFDGGAPGTPYLVMDLLPDSLADRIAGAASLPGDEVAKVGAEVARGLAFAHRHGIVHRDVKPENVLFARDGRAVVTDFGIARAVAGSPTATSRQVVLGTPTYFSPEQARGLPLDGRSDIYALGVTLYRAATGVLPFPGDDWYDVMRQHVEATPARPRSLVSSISPGLDAVIMRCLAKRPDERYATADELAVALETSRGGRPSAAATVAVPGPVGPPRNRTRSRRWIAAAATLAAAAVGAAALRQRPFGGASLGAAAGGANDSGRPITAAILPTTAGTPPEAAAVSTTRPDSARTARAAGRDSTSLPANGRPTGGASPDSLPRRSTNDSARQAASRLPAPALTVNAPPQAVVYLDGIRLAQGTVRREGLRAGRHQVRAIVPSLPGCPSADTTATVSLAPGPRQEVELVPVPCGLLELNVVPAAARYRLVPARGGPVLTGDLPLAQPLFLPEDSYSLTIQAVQCSNFTDTITVVAQRTRTERISMLCN